MSALDNIYRKFLLTKFFIKGWGKPEHILKLFEFRRIISNRNKCMSLVPKDYPITILNQQENDNYRIIQGKFDTPLVHYLPDIVKPEIRDAYFEMIIPTKWSSQMHRPLCIHLAGTGDHYFWKRRNIMAKPLLKNNIGAILLENPFYGLRKPKDQFRSSLHNVSDIFVMGGCLVLECLVLLKWCEKLGFGPLGISGISMGGHMASLAATNWPKPLVLVPCLSSSTASAVFTEGVMSESINWELLQKQFNSDSQFYNMLSKLCTIVDDPFECNFSRVSDLTVPSEGLRTSKPLTPYDLINLCRECNNYSMFDDDTATDQKNTSMTSLLRLNMLNVLRKEISPRVLKNLSMRKHCQEAIWFMRGVMDECTHLKNFSMPFDTSLVIAFCAISDAYVPSQGCSKLEDLWPGATIRYINSGHVGAYLTHLNQFRSAIIEAFQRAQQTYSSFSE
ncbi:hypothetical protein FQR65_LT02970 [Abscondita terminalis]|nr:hypothetical protein FQR65_LT02970 [Abscondita terminalis]